MKKHIKNKLTIEKHILHSGYMIPTYGFPILGSSIPSFLGDHALDTKDGQLLHGLGPDKPKELGSAGVIFRCSFFSAVRRVNKKD